MGKQLKCGWRVLAVIGGMCATGAVQAAGGHHAVDDAQLLEPGQCELESWLTHAQDGERELRAGAACRVGPVELAVGSEYARLDGASQTAWGVEAKWATALADGFSIGAKADSVWAAHRRPRYQGMSASALATWKAGETVALHLNLGRDFIHSGDDQSRYGASVEWVPVQPWLLVAERYKQEGTHFVRAGVRFLGWDDWSIDLSRSQRLNGPVASAWTLGATWQFDRK